MNTYVIVGGVAGGATTATRLRRREESARIILIERGPYVSFANCGLPYHVGGVIAEHDKLVITTPEELEREFALDVRTRHEVTAVHPDDHTVEVRDLAAGETYTLHYDKLVLSPGASPVVPPVPGADLPNVFTLRNIPDMDAIQACIHEHQAVSAVVIGGGFIGLEMAENLHLAGLQVNVIEMLPQVMAPLDPDMAAGIHRELVQRGIGLVLGDGVRSIAALPAGGLEVTVSSGATYRADLAIMAVGVKPESDLARAAGLSLGPRGHIIVNEFMQTSDPNIYAVGDVVQVLDPVTGQPTAVPLASPASRQARTAASHITGLELPYKGTYGTAIVKVFDLVAASTGVNSRRLEQLGIPFHASVTHSYDHAGYYPGATMQTIKLLYGANDGRLLGAQVLGYHAVDRTIDTLATALIAGMTVFDLEELELAYAPPFGAAKDAVNIAGFAAANELRGDTGLATWDQVGSRDPERVGVLDVRTQLEHELGSIDGAMWIPVEELRDRLDELDRTKEWIVFCARGRRAYGADRILRQNGYRSRNLTGGWNTYSQASELQSHPIATHTAAVRSEEAPAPMLDMKLIKTDHSLDATGLQCPGPIMMLYKQMQDMTEGQTVRVSATDPGFRHDVGVWAENTGNSLLALDQEGGVITAVLSKGGPLPLRQAEPVEVSNRAKTMVVFSGNLDHAIAAFIIANGAASMGQHVTMFFTFWGLNILRRPKAPPVKKNLIERMFGWMMPKGPDALRLSQLDMGGLGTAMIKGVMKAKNIDSLPTLIQAAIDSGVHVVACQMTMEMMGIKQEELFDGVTVGGVASMIGATDRANASWFI
ncbi:MAG: FAD-dependent oxidoreductase [Anaerolineae bacterium]|jgi:NADPH-dependent 2,4-dienoyl-CoA reductase/sulfur reductase-like enzyme/peroxiredoxin family protein/TusA-related sulfurtransferase/rhodanese-related sulfurtransferase